MSAIQAITNYVYGAESSFQGALADHSLNFEREAGFAIQILTSGDYIAKLAVTLIAKKSIPAVSIAY